MSQEQLDLLLYAWLSEPDAQRAESKFAAYFRVAFPAMCRYVRSFRATSETAEEIAQQSLIKLFSHLGAKRQAADMRVRDALAALRPLALGELHTIRVMTWRRHVAAIVAAPLSFITSGVSGSLSTHWKELRDDTNGRIEPLTRQGVGLLDEVRRRIEPQLVRWCSSEPTESPAEPAAAGDTADDAQATEARHFAVVLLAWAGTREDAAVNDALACPGAVGFVRSVNTVCDDLARLSIPSNALLFTITKRTFLDSVRCARADERRRVELPAVDDAADLLDELDLEPIGVCTTPSCDERGAAAAAIAGATDADADHAGFGARYRAFLDSLRAPLTRAEGALAEVSRRGEATAERARVAALAAKYVRLVAILRALRESPQPSEDAIGMRLGLTRNQVKYAIETIRTDFSRCFPDLSRDARGRRKRQGTGSA